MLSFINFEEEVEKEDQLRRKRVVQGSGCLPAIVNAQQQQTDFFVSSTFFFIIR